MTIPVKAAGRCAPSSVSWPPFPAVAPSDDVALVLQIAGVFTLVGTAVVARARRRNPAVDAWLVTSRWTLAGAAGGVVLVVLLRVL